MDIHIRGPVEFEKCLDHSFVSAITMTRQRMAIQQLMDQQEDQPLLIQQLTNYCTVIQEVVQRISAKTILQQQPCFTWVIDHEKIVSPCWIFEAIVPCCVLGQLHIQSGHSFLADNNFKDANKAFKKAETVFMQSFLLAQRWKWKLPQMNHKIVRPAWHLSQKHTAESLQHLCCLCVGIDKASSDKTMFTVATRALTSATLSSLHWKTPEAINLLQIADSLRYLYSSNTLWSSGAYGAAIYRLQNRVPFIETGSFELLKKEFEKVPLLLQERIYTNNGAYFEAIEPPDELPTLEMIIHRSLE